MEFCDVVLTFFFCSVLIVHFVCSVFTVDLMEIFTLIV